MIQFDELGLAEPLLRAITAEGYENPTPIQSKVIPAMLDGRDILGTAQTGTGKTAAFVLPILNRVAYRIANSLPRSTPKHCGALIVAPTRELAQQIAESIQTYGRHVRPSVAVVVGGLKPGPQIKVLARGVDILVATPGRLLDHMSTGALRLGQTSVVILDEADQMMDLGFLPAIRKIMSKLPRERQVALLSATMPKQIRALAQDFLVEPVEISVAQEAKPIETIDQRIILVDRASKRRVLIELLNDADVERAIVFTRTKRGADKVNADLGKAGLSSAAIHGNKSQGQRQRALKAFKTGQVRILVATDIAARGIDVEGISHVINFELPNVPEAYVHRIGRTARAGKSGVAISLCDGTERGLLRDIERLIGRKFDVVRDASMANADTYDSSESAKPHGQPRNSRSGKGNSHRGGGANAGGGKDWAAKRNRRKKVNANGGGAGPNHGRSGSGQSGHSRPTAAS